MLLLYFYFIIMHQVVYQIYKHLQFWIKFHNEIYNIKSLVGAPASLN